MNITMDVLDSAFPPEHADHFDPNSPLVDDEIINQIHRSGQSIMQEEVDNWWSNTRQLFGNQATREYSGNINWREILDKERKKRGKSHK